ncbi:MAG TPA: hypothetical protein VFQ51_10095, partial [Vicinamibacteria bacterium]|nr:hypothetical protein [Vicinamibacteria bacterium]
ALAGASDHRFDVFIAPFTSTSLVLGSTSYLQGWHVAGAATTPYFQKKLSFVADVSTAFMGKDEETGGDLTQVSVLLGPRFTFLHAHDHDFMPFLQLTVLGAVIEDKIATGDKPAAHASTGAFAVGGGFDWSHDKRWGTRLQVDYIRPIYDESVRPSVRASFGVIYRFRSPFEAPHTTKPPKEKTGS